MKILLKFTSIELVMLSNHLILCPDFLDASNNSSDGKESVCNAVDPSSVTRSGKYAEEGTGYPLQYSGLENSMDCIVHGVTKSRTRLSNFLFHFQSRVWLFVTPGTVACQARLLMGFSKQEYWSRLPCPPPGDRPHPEIEPKSPALQVDSLLPEPTGKQVYYSEPVKMAGFIWWN